MERPFTLTTASPSAYVQPSMLCRPHRPPAVRLAAGAPCGREGLCERSRSLCLRGARPLGSTGPCRLCRLGMRARSATRPLSKVGSQARPLPRAPCSSTRPPCQTERLATDLNPGHFVRVPPGLCGAGGDLLGRSQILALRSRPPGAIVLVTTTLDRHVPLYKVITMPDPIPTEQPTPAPPVRRPVAIFFDQVVHAVQSNEARARHAEQVTGEPFCCTIDATASFTGLPVHLLTTSPCRVSPSPFQRGRHGDLRRALRTTRSLRLCRGDRAAPRPGSSIADSTPKRCPGN